MHYVAMSKWPLKLVKTCIEMATNAKYYQNAHQTTNIPIISGSLNTATTECCKNGVYSSAWTIHAASTVVKRPVKSVYPVVNGPADKYIGILNTTFKPRNSKSRNDIVVMWTHTSNVDGSHRNWTPNHFVFLASKQSDNNPICIESLVDFPPLSPKTSDSIASSPISFNMAPNTCDSINDLLEMDAHNAEVNDIHVNSELIDSVTLNVTDSPITEPTTDTDVTNLSVQVDHPYKNPG